MKAEGEWEQFIRTGRIADYLNYKSKESEAVQAERTGEQMYAGFRYSDGNGNQNDTCR